MFPNGMRFILRHSATPVHHVELRLVVNAGSAYEDADQRGLAHLVEHLAFAGTTHFPRRQLIGALAALGVRFGADLNAETVFDATDYRLGIDADSADIATALKLFGDWAHGVTFDSAVIAKERSIVLDERRLRSGAGMRYLTALDSVLYAGSPYATRMPIGDSATVANAPVATIARFYHDWYRPERMTVILVGDVDLARIETQLRQTVGAIPKSATPARRPPVLAIPPATERAFVFHDQDYHNSQIDVLAVDPPARHGTVSSLRSSLVTTIYFTALQERFANLNDESRPTATLNASLTNTVDSASVFDLVATTPLGGSADSALVLAVGELTRVARDGFSVNELARARARVLGAYDHLYAQRGTNSSDYLAAFVDIARRGGSVSEPGVVHDWAKRMLGTGPEAITPAEITTYARYWATPGRWLVAAALPGAPDHHTSASPAPPDTGAHRAITRGRLLAVADSVSRAVNAVAARTASGDSASAAMSAVDVTLVPVPPTPGRIAQARTIAGTGVQEWTLSNGMRVVLKPTASDADQLVMVARAPGGLSLAADSEYPSAVAAPSLIQSSGIGRYSAREIRDRLAGTTYTISASLNQLSEEMRVSGTAQNAALLLKMLNAEFQAPRMDSSVVTKVLTQSKLAQYSADQQLATTKQIVDTDHNPHARPVTGALLDSVQTDLALGFWRARVANASNWTVYIVGAFNPDSLRPVVERYLASLPAGHVEHWHDWGVHPASGQQRIGLPGGSANQTIIKLSYAQTLPHYDRETDLAMALVAQLLQRRLTARLREELGGTYSPQVTEAAEAWPHGVVQIQAQFDATPDLAPSLTQAALAVADSLRANGPTAAEVHDVVEAARQSTASPESPNVFWLSHLMNFDWNGWALAAGMDDYGPLLAKMTPERLRAAAQTALTPGPYVVFTLTSR